MVYRGRVKNGVVVFEGDVTPPEGTQVTILDAADSPQKSGVVASDDLEAARMRQMLLKFAGVLDDLPTDLARNHDHYIHGAPKQ